MSDDGTSGDGQSGGAGKESFEARLRSAQERRGLDAPASGAAKGSGGGSAPSALGVGMRVGVELLSAMVVGLAIGWALDHWLHTSPAFLVLFVLLGGAAGIANVWRLMGAGRMPGGR
jgi:ATP synthase protein I